MEDGSRSSRTIGPEMGGFFAGIIVGAAVAGIAALLYAPRSGEETRERLKAEWQETQNMFQIWSDDVRKRIESLNKILCSLINANVDKEAQPTGDGQRPPT